MHVCILANAHTHTDTHSRTVRDGLPSFNCHAFPHWPHLVAFLRETLVSLFTSKLCAWPADCTFTSPCYPATAALVLGPPDTYLKVKDDIIKYTILFILLLQMEVKIRCQKLFFRKLFFKCIRFLTCSMNLTNKGLYINKYNF